MRSHDLAFAATLAFLSAVAACASSPARTDAAGAGGADRGGAGGGSGRAGGGSPGGGAGAMAGQSGGGGIACPTVARPPEAPAGWSEYALFDCRYRIFVPATRDQLPGPLTWKDCDDRGPDLTSCRDIAITWSTDGDNAVGGVPEAYVDDAGRVVLQLRNIYEDRRSGSDATMALVVEADGAVRQAIFTPYAPSSGTGFWLLPAGVAPGKALWKIIDWDSTPQGRAAIGGADDLLRPPVVFGLDGNRGGGWAGSRWIVELTLQGYKIVDWNSGAQVATAWPLTDGSIPRFQGDVLYLSYVAPTDSGLWVWTQGAGTVKLRGYGDDPTRGVGGLGTDGTDMVWLEGEQGDPARGGGFQTRSIYAAPFTTDPGALQPRRVRAWDGQFLDTAYPPAVGCGYAAFVDNSAVSYTLNVVRLADGAAWKIRSPGRTPGEGWNLPIAITCDEVFAQAGENLKRFSIASLGPAGP